MCDQQCIRSACAYAQSDQSLCLSLDYTMTVKLLTEHHLEVQRGCAGSPAFTHVKMPHCWKSHARAHMSMYHNSLKRTTCITRLCWTPTNRTPDKSAYQKINFLISQPKHMLWVLKLTVSMRRFFQHPKHMFKLMGKKIITILR